MAWQISAGLMDADPAKTHLDAPQKEIGQFQEQKMHRIRAVQTQEIQRRRVYLDGEK
jgi:hypothetical protein